MKMPESSTTDDPIPSELAETVKLKVTEEETVKTEPMTEPTTPQEVNNFSHETNALNGKHESPQKENSDENADAEKQEEEMPANNDSMSDQEDDYIMTNSDDENENSGEDSDKKKDAETATDATAESLAEDKPEKHGTGTPIVSSSKKSRPPYKYDPSKITLRFLFANRDGLTVTLECNPADTVGEVKGALISVWPKDMPPCDEENLRLVCMGKGYLTPDSRTLEDCQIPVFKTHPTPINVSIKPKVETAQEIKNKKSHNETAASQSRNPADPALSTAQASRGCGCTIL